MQELFKTIGGVEGISKFLDEFYPIMLNDDRVNEYFKDIDLKTLKSHQTFFLSYVFGGVPEYSRDSLNEPHKRLKITDEVFDITLNNMLKAFKAIEVDKRSIIAAMSILESTRSDIVSN